MADSVRADPSRRDAVPSEGAPATARVTDRPLETLDLRQPASTADGAWLVFEGRVRDENEGRRVRELEYSAYQEMAEKELLALAEEALARFEVGRIAAAHRIGRLEPGEVSVVIAVSAPHRDDCYAASRWVIEQIKHRLPIWKRERYTDGSEAWVGSEEAVE